MTEEIQFCLDAARESMDKSLSHLQNELTKVRAGKASASMLEGIMVEAYGANSPINQLANVSTPDARTLAIQPWDKSVMANIEKAILKANIGLTPQNDGEYIRLNIPPLTEERRKELVRQTKTIAENAKVSIRGARKDANDEIKSLQSDGIPEDMAKRAETAIQDLTNEFSGKVDKFIEKKEAEIMTV